MQCYNFRQILYQPCSPSKRKFNILHVKFTYNWRTQLILKLLKTLTCMSSLLLCIVFVKVSSSSALGQTVYFYFVLSGWKWSLLLKRRKELRRTLTLKQCLVKDISLFHHINIKKESQQLVNLKIPVLRCIKLETYVLYEILY